MRGLAEKSRSRARLGADTARVWARELVLGNPYAKSVLLAVANYMNEDGAAWPGISTISRDTDISEDTVTGRLRWLESIGAIALFKCWVDEHGRRNYEGRGRVTSSEIRFLFDADVEAIEDAAKGNAKPVALRGAAARSHAERSDVSPRPQRVQNSTPEQGVSPGLAPEQPPPPAARTEELDSDSPQSPPLPEQPAEPPPVETGKAYEEFTTAYGEGSVRPDKARALWSALTEDERDLAIRGAKGYRQQRLSTKKALIDPERFLRNRDLWTEFAAKAPAEQAERLLIEVDSDAGRAVRTVHSIGGVPSPQSVSVRGRMMFSLPAEPSAAVLALNRAPPLRDWSVVEPMTQEFGAWRAFVETHTGKAARAQQHVVGQRQGDPGPDGKPVYLGLLHREGFKVPMPFPPRVDGSWPEVDDREEPGAPAEAPDQLSKAG